MPHQMIIDYSKGKMREGAAQRTKVISVATKLILLTVTIPDQILAFS